MRQLLAVLVVGSVLAGCGAPADDTPAGQQFKAQFDKATRDSCLKAAVSKGVAADTAVAYCECLVEQSDQLSNNDKVSLSMSPDKMRAMGKLCAAKLRRS